ncbi:MAG: hypothetical protein WDN29_04150 [Methylovirgula sp.]
MTGRAYTSIVKTGSSTKPTGWVLYQKEPHLTYLRVEFSFDHRLDDAFHLDIKKSQIILNDDLANWLQGEFLTAPRREANRRSREGQQKLLSKKGEGAHDTSNNNIRNREAAAGGPKVNIANPNTGERRLLRTSMALPG